MAQIFKTMGAFVISCMLLISIGCKSGGMVKEEMAKISKVGILAVTIDNVGEGKPGNAKVLQDMAEYGRTLFEKELSSITNWTFIDHKKIHSIPAIMKAANLKDSPHVRRYLHDGMMNDPDAQADEMLLSLLSGGEGTAEKQKDQLIDDNLEVMQAMYEKELAAFQSVKNLPKVPYPFLRKQYSNTIYLGDIPDEDKNHLYEPLVINIAEACKQADIDALFVIYYHTLVSKGATTVIINGRGLGDIYCNATLALVTKNRTIAIDYDIPTLDDFSPLRLAVGVFEPVYSGNSRKLKDLKDLLIDLNDRKGDVRKVYKELIEESTNRVIATLKADLSEE